MPGPPHSPVLKPSGGPQPDRGAYVLRVQWVLRNQRHPSERGTQGIAGGCRAGSGYLRSAGIGSFGGLGLRSGWEVPCETWLALRWAIRVRSRSQSRRLLDGIKNYHSRDWAAVFLLLGRVHAVGVEVHRQAVYLLLHGEVFEFPIIVGVLLLDNGDCTAVAGNVNSPQTRIKLDDFAPGGDGQECDGLVLVEIKDRH